MKDQIVTIVRFVILNVLFVMKICLCFSICMDFTPRWQSTSKIMLILRVRSVQLSNLFLMWSRRKCFELPGKVAAWQI